MVIDLWAGAVIAVEEGIFTNAHHSLPTHPPTAALDDHFPGKPELADIPSVFSSTCSRRERLRINGHRLFIQAHHPTKSDKALKETQSTDPNQ